jgi:hypothetical protein
MAAGELMRYPAGVNSASFLRVSKEGLRDDLHGQMVW